MKIRDNIVGRQLKLKDPEKWIQPCSAIQTARRVFTQGHYKTLWVATDEGTFKETDFKGFAD